MCETRKMQSVSAIKTIRIICMLFVLRQIKCDVVEMEGASNDKQILYVTDCTANCMQRNLTAVNISKNEIMLIFDFYWKL